MIESILKHRMTRWLLRLFVVLSLVSSWGAQAVLDQVPPSYSAVWVAAAYPNDPTLFASPMDICIALTTESVTHAWYGNYKGAGPREQGFDITLPPTILDNYAVCNYTRSDTTPPPYNPYASSAWSLYLSIAWPNLHTAAVCPTATPAYKFNPASGMCERDLPDQCLAPNVIDATGKCGPPPCTAVDPLPALPKDDLCAQSLNDGKGVDIRHQCPDITDDMKKGVECLAKKIAAFYPPITYSGPSATIRNKAYQQHLLDVYTRSIDIETKVLTDEDELACAAVIADVDNEMDWHKIKAGPSKKGDEAPHVKGEAIDIPEDVANALIERCTKTNVKAFVTTYFPGCIKCLHIPLVTGNVEDYINSAVINPPACNLEWGGLFKNNYDPIHFQLPQKK